MINQNGKPILPPDAAIGVVLFAGGGGTEAGFVEAGIRPVIAVEFDPGKPKLSKAIADCHSLNFAEYGCKVIRQTVQEVAALGFPGFPLNPDYLHASPVCSNFSNAKRDGIESDEDKTAANAVATAIAHLQPKHFTLENVPRYKKSQSFQLILAALCCQGYRVAYNLVDMSDYGLPQMRKRLILTASRETPISLPPKVTTPMGWYEAIAPLIPSMINSTLVPGQQKAVTNFLSRNKPAPLLIKRTGARNANYRYKPGNLPYYTLLRSIFTDQNGANRNKFNDIWLPDGTVKSLSIKAAAILQGFPSWYKFPSSAAVAGSIIGYSVPPSFARLLFQSRSPKSDKPMIENPKITKLAAEQLRKSYEFNSAPIAILIRLLPGDGDGRMTVVAVQNHQDAPLVQTLHSPSMSDTFEVVMELLEDLKQQLPRRYEAKLNSNKASFTKADFIPQEDHVQLNLLDLLA